MRPTLKVASVSWRVQGREVACTADTSLAYRFTYVEFCVKGFLSWWGCLAVDFWGHTGKEARQEGRSCSSRCCTPHAQGVQKAGIAKLRASFPIESHNANSSCRLTINCLGLTDSLSPLPFQTCWYVDCHISLKLRYQWKASFVQVVPGLLNSKNRFDTNDQQKGALKHHPTCSLKMDGWK